MATITSAATGNFSSTATWVGGVVPGAADIAVAATGHTVTIDGNITVTKLTQAGTGKYVVTATRTITGDIEASASNVTNGGTVTISASSGNTVTIIGNLFANTSGIQNNVASIVMTGTGTIICNGSITAGSGNGTGESGAILYVTGNSTITINGDLNGGPSGNRRAVSYESGSTGSVLTVNGNIKAEKGTVFGVGLNVNTDITITVIGDVIGGNGAPAAATGINLRLSNTNLTVNGTIYSGSYSGIRSIGGNATVTINGNVVGNSGVSSEDYSAIVFSNNGTGSSGSKIIVNGSVISENSFAIVSKTGGDTSNSGVFVNGNIIYSNSYTIGATNYVGGLNPVLSYKTFLISNASTGYTRYTRSIDQGVGTYIDRVDPGLTTGMPTESDVREGTIYGNANTLTGTLSVPAVNSVAAGVAVDNTVGTAALTPSSIADLIGAQIAAALDAVP